MILVSACLLGMNCKYNGGHNYNEEVIAYLKGKTYMSVCPEELGGLLTPRKPCEIIQGKVINSMGEDVTEAFYKGAEKTVELAKQKQVTLAILQVRSPSCGVGRIYDGNFSSILIDGNGITAEKLMNAGIEVIASNQIKDGKICK